MPESAPQRVVLRASFGVWVFALACALALYLTVDALVRGAVLFALTALPWELLVLWVIYVVTVRPCVVVTRDELVIVNVARVHHVPWPAIEELTSRFQLAVVLVGGRRIASWGAPSLGVDKTAVSGMPRELPTPRASGTRAARARRPELPVSSIIESARGRWDESSAPAGPARSGWDRPVLIGTLVVVAGCVLSGVLTGSGL